VQGAKWVVALLEHMVIPTSSATIAPMYQMIWMLVDHSSIGCKPCKPNLSRSNLYYRIIKPQNPQNLTWLL
jgi:hypothetical protein